MFKKLSFCSFVILGLLGYPLSVLLLPLFGSDTENSNAAIFVRIVWIISGLLSLLLLRDSKFKFTINFLIGYFFIFILSIRLFCDLFIFRVYTFIPSDIYYIFFFGTVVFPVIIFSNINNLPITGNQCFYFCKFTAYFALLLNLVFAYITTGSIVDQLITGERFSSEKFNPISFSHLSVTTLGLIIVQFFSPVLRKINLLDFIALAMSLVTLGISNSRGPTISLLCIFVFISYLNRSKFLKSALITILLIGIIIFVYFLIGSIVDVDLFSRFNSIGDSDDGSFVSRSDSFGAAFNDFLSNPLFGSSIVLSDGGYPHNLTLEIMMSTGLLGLFLYLVINYLVFKYTLVLHEKFPEWFFVGIISIQYIIGFQFSGTIWQSVEWIFPIAFIFFIINHKNIALRL